VAAGDDAGAGGIDGVKPAVEGRARVGSDMRGCTWMQLLDERIVLS
jgi:hypothetical protein